MTVTGAVLELLAVRFYQGPRYPNQTKPNREAEEKRLEATQGVWKGRLRLAGRGCSLCDHGPILVLERRLKATFSC